MALTLPVSPFFGNFTGLAVKRTWGRILASPDDAQVLVTKRRPDCAPRPNREFGESGLTHGVTT